MEGWGRPWGLGGHWEDSGFCPREVGAPAVGRGGMGPVLHFLKFPWEKGRVPETDVAAGTKGGREASTPSYDGCLGWREVDGL